MKKIVLLVRSFNDIDHFTPLIDRILQRESLEIDVYNINWHYELSANSNIEYLARQYGLHVANLWGGDDSTWGEKLILRLITRTSRSVVFFRSRLSRFNKYRRSLEIWLYGLLSVDKIFVSRSPDIIVFDWMNAAHPRNVKIAKLAKARNVPTVCLPHGVWVYSNQFATEKTQLKDPNKQLYYDYYPCPGSHTNYLMERGVPKARIKEIGSMRYCREWLSIYGRHIIAESFNTECQKNLRLIIFLSQSFYNVNNENLANLIETITSLDDLTIVIKPHTRGISADYIKKIIGNNNVQIHEEISSVALIDWADAAVVYGSSIAIQVLAAGKALLYPTYIDANTVHFSDMKACWEFSNSAEILPILKKLIVDKQYRPYRKEDVTSFLKKIVYAGDDQRDVISDYLDSIVEYSEQKNTPLEC